MARAREELSLALPALLVVATALVLAPLQGGYATTTWYPAGLFLLAIALLALVLAPSGAHGRSMLVSIAVTAFAMFALWNLASIIWADDRGAAWDGGNRALVYAVAAAVLARRPWIRPVAGGVFGAVGVGLALVAAGVLVATLVADRPSELFLEGRLAAPIDYANATANLWLIGFFPCLWMAVAPGIRWPSRATGLAAACLLLQMAMLSQSRGAVLALGVAAVVFLAVTPVRAVALLAMAVPAGLTAAGFDTLTAVREAATIPAQQEALAEARRLILASCLIAGGVAAAAGALVSRLPSGLHGRRARRAGNLGVAGLGVAALVAGVVAVGSPGDWVDARWRDFKTSGYSQVAEGRTRFSGTLGSSRYDFWRVSLDMFEERPLTGAGADNFAGRYLLDRRADESPVHPHSLAFRILGQLGIVGAVLFLGFLSAAILAAMRTLRRASDRGRALGAAGLAGFSAWFVHALVDWLWVFPALVLLALTLLLVTARLEDDEDEPRAPAGRDRLVATRDRRPPPRVTLVTGGLAALLAAVSLAAPALAARFTTAAYDDAATSVERTLARLDRAARLNRLAAEPLIAKGVVARRLGRVDVARAAFAEAAEREPSNWFVHFEIALTAAETGRREEAMSAATRAEQLNPRQRAVRELLDNLHRGEKVVALEFEQSIVEAQEVRLRPVEGR